MPGVDPQLRPKSLPLRRRFSHRFRRRVNPLSPPLSIAQRGEQGRLATSPVMRSRGRDASAGMLRAENETSPPVISWGLARSRIGGSYVSAPTPRPRKPAVPREGKPVKASIQVDAKTHALWAAAAALRGMDRSAFAVEAIQAACKGLVLVDRRKSPGSVKITDRVDHGDEISEDEEKAA